MVSDAKYVTEEVCELRMALTDQQVKDIIRTIKVVGFLATLTLSIVEIVARHYP